MQRLDDVAGWLGATPSQARSLAERYYDGRLPPHAVGLPRAADCVDGGAAGPGSRRLRPGRELSAGRSATAIMPGPDMRADDGTDLADGDGDGTAGALLDPRSERVRSVGVRQVLHGDVGRPVADPLDGELLQPRQRLGRRAHLLQRCRRCRRRGAAAASPTAPTRRARPPCRSDRHAAGTRGCRRRTARTPTRSGRARSARRVVGVRPGRGRLGRREHREPEPHADRPAVDDPDGDRAPPSRPARPTRPSPTSHPTGAPRRSRRHPRAPAAGRRRRTPTARDVTWRSDATRAAPRRCRPTTRRSRRRSHRPRTTCTGTTVTRAAARLGLRQVGGGVGDDCDRRAHARARR